MQSSIDAGVVVPTGRYRSGVVRRTLAMATVAMLLTVVSACSNAPADSASSKDSDKPAGSLIGDPNRALPKPVALPPVDKRPTWFEIQAPSADVAAKSEEAEQAEIDARRRAAPPDGPQFDSRTHVAEPSPPRWMELAVDVETRRNMTPVWVSRSNAVIAVAMYDAVITDERAGVVDERRGPDGSAPSVLPEDVVAGGAAWEVETKLFPAERARFDRLAASQKRVSAAQGHVWPSTYDAAWEYGVAVADQVLAQAATDGSGEPPKPWTPPPGATWEPTPSLYAPPLDPQAGTWRPWNLKSPDQFRPPPPPKPGSKELDAALAQVKRNVANLSDPQFRIAKFWEMGPGTSTPAGYWIQDVTIPLIDDSPTDVQVTVLAMVTTAIADASIATWDAKYHYGLARPVTLIRRGDSPGDKTWISALQTPPFPSYVSGHSTFSSAAAVVLAGLFPSIADRLATAAAEASDSRNMAGIHYWFDDYRGSELGGKIARTSLQRFGLDADAELPLSKELIDSADSKPRDAQVGSAGIRLDG